MDEPDALDLALIRASARDIPTVERHIAEASDWLWRRGISQWRPSNSLTTEITTRVKSGDAYLAVLDGNAVGSVWIQSGDSIFWPEKTDQARYVHKLVIDRAHAGRGVGRAMLTAAERIVRGDGVPVIRLDTHARSEPLLRYYRDAGYSVVDEQRVGELFVARLEKRL